MSMIDLTKLGDFSTQFWNRIGEKFSVNSLLSDNKSKTHIAQKFELASDRAIAQALINGNAGPASGRTMAGNKNVFATANTFVRRIQFGVKNYTVGEIVNGCQIYAVKKSDNTILEALVINKSGTVIEGNVVDFDINKSFNEDVYFIVGCNYVSNGNKGMALGAGVDNGVAFDKATPETILEVGAQVDSGTRRSILVSIFGVGGDLSKSFTEYNPITKELTRFDGTTVQISQGDNNGISREEFDRHTSANEQQHQTINSSISANTRKIDAANQKIADLENNAVMKGSENIFTSKNVFTNRSPIVDKYFSIKNITADGINELYTGGTYCCNPREGITTNSFISAIVLPIYNSRPGDTVQASYFMFNASSFRTTSNVSALSTYTVQDIQYQGHYCIVIEINNTFNYPVGFGFRVEERYAEARRIGLLKQALPNQSSNNAWSSYFAPPLDGALSLTDKFMIPYTITQKAQSEVVTRFDLANNTIPINNYQVGEIKTFVIDLSESIIIDNKTWIRCEGQTVNRDTDGNILTSSVKNANAQTSITLPVSEEGKYIYVCAY